MFSSLINLFRNKEKKRNSKNDSKPDTIVAIGRVEEKKRNSKNDSEPDKIEYLTIDESNISKFIENNYIEKINGITLHDEYKILKTIENGHSIKWMLKESLLISDDVVILHLDMPNVEYIGKQAFSWNETLISVNIPNVKYIYDGAFSFNRSLTSINMPNVEYIYEGAFSFNNSLISVSMPKLIEFYGGVFSYSRYLTNVEIPNEAIRRSSEYACKNSFLKTIFLENYNIDKNKGSIENISIEPKTLNDKYEKIEYLTIDESNISKFIENNYIEKINVKRYYENDESKILKNEYKILKTIENGHSIKWMLKESLSASEDVIILHLDMPNVEYIPVKAFYENETLISVNIPNVKYIDDSAFSFNRSLTSINMPNVSEIFNYSFDFTTSLENVVMPKKHILEFKQTHAFYDCKFFENLRNLRSDKLVIIDNILIDGLKASGHVEVPDNVTIVNEFAFDSNKSLTSISMPNVETIYLGAFIGATSLITIDMPKVKWINSFAFEHIYTLDYSMSIVPATLTEEEFYDIVVDGEEWGQ
ncbi:leucine-rich repeat protein [Mycoplasma sp. CSL10137]|uniref:leucine-rich repeat protein n=1 Tax=Mycoplasma sp. CSL10137 TaxID=2813824 RepID=UPI00197BEEF5|nr:leucine-rich repeat domain-containing protein [Mycoplasma sp. CSL10137]MBN4083446.1 leucine-rich repeat protein [Mycoplasma sp. CSL10137]